MFPTIQLFNNIVLNSYGICIGIGGFLGYLYLLQNSKNAGIKIEMLPLIYLISIVSAFLGGKLFFLFENLPFYINNPYKIFENLSNGFVIYGGILLSSLFFFLFLKLNKKSVLLGFDYLSLTCLIIQFCGKIGCFLTGCCYGKESTLFINTNHTVKNNFPTPIHKNLHPTQIYEAFIVLIIFFYLNWIKGDAHKNGTIFFRYIFLYSFFRFFTEFLRGDASRGFLFDGFISHAQFISIILCVISFYFVFSKNKLIYKI
jgi:phosphatidylglycerol:prolipoprotein diacylglycerol transferase